MNKLTLLAGLAAPLLISSAQAGIVTTGLVHEWTAATEDGTDTRWNDNVAGGQEPEWDLTDTGSVQYVAVTGSSTNFTHAFRWDGSDIAQGEDAVGNQIKSGNFSQVSASTDTTFEMWVKYDASGLATSSHATLLDFGGSGNGAGIYLYNDAGQIKVQARPSTSDLLEQEVATTASDFVHVVMAIDAVNNDYSLFIDGVEANTSLNKEDFGNNPVGLGGAKGQAGGLGASAGNLVGDIAVVRIYDGIAFGQAEVNQNIADAVIPEPASLALLGLGGLALIRRR